MRWFVVLALLACSQPVSSYNGIHTEIIPVLDDLARADESGASTGITGPSAQGHSWLPEIQDTAPPLDLVSNHLVDAAPAATPESHITTVFPINQVCEYELGALPANGNYYYCFVRVANPGVASAMDGYFCGVNSGATAGGITQGWINNNGAPDFGGAGDVGSPAVGDRMRCLIIGSTLYLSWRTSSGWSLISTRDVTTGESDGTGVLGWEQSVTSTGYMVGIRGGAYRAPQAAMMGVGGM